MIILFIFIIRFQRNDNSFHAVSFSQHERHDSKALYPAEDLPCRQIVNENQPIIIASGAYRHPLLANCLHNNTSIDSYLGLPINDHSGSVIGIINTFGKERSFSELDINLVETAGQMVASEFELLEKEKEKKQFQEQILRAQKLEGIGVLAGGIAHNFNNILMGIQGRVSLMLMDKDYSKPYFKKLVERSVSMFGQTKKEISIHYNFQPGLWAVETDQNQIEQVLLNLFVNAWQAMPEGGELSIQTQNVMLDESYMNLQNLKPGRYVKISVTDNGVGMDEKTRQRIFDPFFTTKEIGRGTGLGLASAYGIVKNHGGIITVYSEKGHGSTFNIYLPASEKYVSEEKRTSEKISTGTGNILLVDDEDMILEVNRSMLEAIGYKVMDANSGEKAVRIYQKEKNNIDIVILDMIMPEMSGGQTLDRLKEINPDIKVILSSGYSLSGQGQEILDRGCNGFIQKPFNMNDLSRKIKEIMEKR
jgi:signal transduction histidine kinase/ActR/RegA family two-component response regulator